MSLVYLTLGAHASLFVSLCLLFASVGRASARIIASSTWTLFTSPLTHRLVLLCVDAHCFIFWDQPGDVLAAPESALCDCMGVSFSCNTSLSLSHQLFIYCFIFSDLPGDVRAAPASACVAGKVSCSLCVSLSLSPPGVRGSGLGGRELLTLLGVLVAGLSPSHSPMQLEQVCPFSSSIASTKRVSHRSKRHRADAGAVRPSPGRPRSRMSRKQHSRNHGTQ